MSKSRPFRYFYFPLLSKDSFAFKSTKSSLSSNVKMSYKRVGYDIVSQVVNCIKIYVFRSQFHQHFMRIFCIGKCFSLVTFGKKSTFEQKTKELMKWNKSQVKRMTFNFIVKIEAFVCILVYLICSKLALCGSHLKKKHRISVDEMFVNCSAVTILKSLPCFR